MVKLSRKSVLYTLLIILAIGFISCSKDDKPKESENSIPENIRKANTFIVEYMEDGYLWSDKIPTTINPQGEEDPFAMLNKMIYKDLDKWTYVTDDADAAMKDFQGVATTFGYSLAFGKFSNKEEFFAIVEYIVKGGKAEEAGLKRGDIILLINNVAITKKNYLELIYGKSISITLGKDEDNKISASGSPIAMISKEMYEDPVNTYKIIDVNGVKIGYLAYTKYLKESHQRLDAVFTAFKNAGVKEVVLDLRYNPGGNALTPPYLASFLAPIAAVTKGDVFLKETWNSKYMAYYAQKGEDLNDYFNKNCAANLNLNRVFVLTTSGTASASEATISGLMPYLDVVKIGTTTHGKYCGAVLLRPIIDNKGTLDPLIKNWLLSMVIYKFVNTAGFTDFKDGIKPDYEVKDDLFNAYQFGDTKDPHLAKAISIITGVQSTKAAVAKHTLQEGIDYVMLPELTEKLNKDYGNTRIIDIREAK